MDTIDLSDFFNTKSEADDFALRLDIVLKQIFETSFNPNVSFLEHFGIQKKDAFMSLMRDNSFNSNSRQSIKEFIELVLGKIRSLQTISLVLAFEPKPETLKMLSQWFVLNMKKQVVFEIKVDPNLIGGAAILSGGRYLDFSIKPQFEKTFMEMANPTIKK